MNRAAAAGAVREQCLLQREEKSMSRYRAYRLSLLVAAAALVLSSASGRAEDDAYMKAAKAYIAKVTAPGAPWTGPSS